MTKGNKPPSLDETTLQAEDLATNQEVVPVPYVAGTRQVALRWLSRVENVIAGPSSTAGGKKGGGGGKKGGSSSGTRTYYGSLLGAICLGPASTLEAVLVDGKQIVTGPVSGSGDSSDLTLDTGCEDYEWPVYGRGVVFWGTSTQVITDEFPVGHPFAIHPNYRSIALLAWDFAMLGPGRTAAPNVQVIVSRTPVVDTSIVAGGDNVLDDGQANPVAVIAELLTAAWGLQLATASLQAADWLAAAAYCAANWDRYGVSSLVTSQVEARSLLPELLAVFDAALYWTAAGKLGIRLLRPGVNPGGLTSLDTAHYTAPPRIDGGGLADLPTAVSARFLDRSAAYKEREAVASNTLTSRRRLTAQTDRIDLRHVTRFEQAAAMAADAVRRLAHPVSQIEVRVRAGIAGSLGPGEKVLVNANPDPSGAAVQVLAVIQDRRDEPFGPAEMTLSPDLVSDAAPGSPAEPDPDVPDLDCDPIDEDAALVVPLPTPRWDMGSFAVVAPRPDASVVGMRVHFAPDTDADGNVEDEILADLGVVTSFAALMTLDEDLTESETAIDLTLADGADGPDAYVAGLTPDNEADAQQDELLLILANVDANGRVVVTDGVPEIEFCSIISRTAIDTDSHTYTVLRARCGLPARVWTSSASPRAYILPLSSLSALTHENALALLQTGYVGHVRLDAINTVTTWSDANPSDPFPEITWVMPGAYDRAPVIAWATPSGSNGTNTSGSYTPSLALTDSDGDMVSVLITSSKTDGTGYTEHKRETLAPTGSYSFNASLTLTTGAHTLSVMATDRAGHVLTSTRNITITAGAAVGPQPPSFSPPDNGGSFTSSVAVTVTAVSPATDLEYAVCSLGSAVPASWTAEGDLQTALTLTSGKRVWARAIGPSPSVTAFSPGSGFNNQNIWVGCRFVVGSEVSVTKLGRVFQTGSTGSHPVKIVRVSDGALMASATWEASGGTHDQFHYVTLASPVTLAAGTQYYLASQEFNGGDSWYSNLTQVTTTGDVTVQYAVYSADGSSFSTWGAAGSYSYGPVGFEYIARSAPVFTDYRKSV